MKKNKYLLLTTIILSALFLGACNLPTGESDADADATTIASTSAAVFTHAAETAVGAVIPSATTQPGATALSTAANTPISTVPPASTATEIPIPCNRGSFVKDVTIPDSTEIPAGDSFTKTWRIKNDGSCTWGANYVVLFDSGEQMGAPASAALGGSVAPGATIDISVNLTAPVSPGNYQGNFKLRSHDNIVFGINADAQGPFWVKIVVPNPTPTPTNTPTSPDLTITNLTLNPNPPTQGVNVNVSITVYNQGQTDADAFVLEWRGGENFTTASCTWNIASLAGGDSVTKTCDTFAYTSWYASITTKAEVDTTGAISESDEGNNVITESIQVLMP